MIIFLYGEDSFRLRQKLNEIIGQHQKASKTSRNLIYFDGKESGCDSFAHILRQNSLFADKKLIIAKNLFSNAVDESKYLNVLKRNSRHEDIILIHEEGAINRGKLFFKFLKQKAKSQEFSFLDPVQLRLWVRKECSLAKAAMSSQAEAGLIEFVGNDLWRLSNEIKKLASFKDRGRIEIEDVELLVKPKIDTDIFKTIDAIALQDKKRAIFLLRRHLEKGDNALYLLSMINFQFRNLLVVKDLLEKNLPRSAVLKATKLHPFVVQKSCQQARSFSLPQLKKTYRSIFQADLDVKRGRVEPEAALDLLISGF